MPDRPQTDPVFYSYLTFSPARIAKYQERCAAYQPERKAFLLETIFNPVRSTIWVAGDTLDTLAPKGTEFSGLAYEIAQEDKRVQEGVVTQFVNHKYEELIALPPLSPGVYAVNTWLLDKQGKRALHRKTTIEKKDEAKVFSKWWKNKYGNTNQVLKPFSPLAVAGAAPDKTSRIACFGREYQLDGLGMPVQILSNGGPVLTAPARIFVTVNGRETAIVPESQLQILDAQPWRVTFEGKAEAAGLRFTTQGTLEQDGLVDLRLTYQPASGATTVQELWIEWPIDDQDHNYMAVVGPGGNYSPRYLGVVPSGQGEVWNTLKDMGNPASSRVLGNFQSNVWIGTEKRGLLWAGDSDEGWFPNNETPAHAIRRDQDTVTLQNNILLNEVGATPVVLATPRTIRFQYMASPFKKLPAGWRLSHRSAANGFLCPPKYKINWDTGKKHFQILSPPFKDTTRWPEYYAHCKEVAEQRARQGLFSTRQRLQSYLTNQIPLRGYGPKTLEPGLYKYFSAEWVGNISGEFLNPTYTDYMVWLQRRQVVEGGCRHFYYDISGSKVDNALPGGTGYRLPDGRVQPTSLDGRQRNWCQRVNAMMQECGFYPAGISGHCTNAFVLKALPWYDCVLDAEYPMKDPIDSYNSERMIAFSCPHNFGVNINHLHFMNKDWAALHDANMGGGGGVFDSPAFRHWGIGCDDVEFIPYWRNRDVVRRIADGLLSSIWTRPHSAILAILNHGPDPKGQRQTRACQLRLDLPALGIPDGAEVRVRDLYDNRLVPQHFKQFKWYEELSTTVQVHKSEYKELPSIAPKLNLQTGELTGFDIPYHYQYYIVVSWNQPSPDEQTWEQYVPAELHPRIKEWGITRAREVKGDELSNLIGNSEAQVQIHAWHQKQQLLLSIKNLGAAPLDGELQLELAKLGLKIDPETRMWAEYNLIYGLGTGQDDHRQPLAKCIGSGESIKEVMNRRPPKPIGTVLFNPWNGKVFYRLGVDQQQLVCLSKAP